MYRNLSVIAMAPVLDEEHKIGEVVRRVPRPLVDEVLVIDDGCTDKSPEVARTLGATVLPMGRTVGVGAALRAGYRYAVEKGFDVAVVMAGNNKDSPEEIPALLDPIADGRADFVQGSRFLKGDANFGHMPLYRRVATRLHPLLFSLAARRRVTESTNGFRAVHRRVDEGVGQRQVPPGQELLVRDQVGRARLVAIDGPFVVSPREAREGHVHVVGGAAHDPDAPLRDPLQAVVPAGEVSAGAGDQVAHVDRLAGLGIGHEADGRRLVLQVVERGHEARGAREGGVGGHVGHPLVAHPDLTLVLERLEEFLARACRHGGLVEHPSTTAAG